MEHAFFWLYSAYFVFNLLNATVITHQSLNKYIAPFKHTLKGEMNAVVGNLFTLNVFGMILLLIVDNMYYFAIGLLIITGLMNVFLFAISIFDLFFGNAFTRESIDMAKNPAKGISKGLPKEIFKELIIYYRIILFIPFVVLLCLMIWFGRSTLVLLPIPFDQLPLLLMIAVSLLMIIICKMSFEKMYQNNLTIKAVKSTFAIQNLGIYPQYLFEFLKIKRRSDHREVDLSKHIANYTFYNKNKHHYTNWIDHQVYSNDLKQKQVATSIHIDQTLLKDHHSLTGILKGKNLVLVQVESMSRFLLDIPLLKDEFPFLRALLKESVDFTQCYSSVGLGVSSDAELTTLTGLYPNGYQCFYWSNFDSHRSIYKKHRQLNTLPKLFNDFGYDTEGIHGDYKQFYNREYAYPQLMGFKRFTSLTDFKHLTLNNHSKRMSLYRYTYLPDHEHVSPWISDYQLADTIRKQIKKLSKPTFLFPITMMPHTPFEFYPEEQKEHSFSNYRLKELTKKYIRFADYYDGFIKRFFLDEHDKMAIDSQTVYLFYGDHGCGIKNGDIAKLFERKLSYLEERRLLQQIVCFLYVPGTKNKVVNGYQLKEGLIKGKQTHVRGQMDIYRSLIELFGISVKHEAYFGTHLLSDEPTYVLDNKLQDVMMDELIFSMRNPQQVFPKHAKVNQQWFEHIRKFKILNDALIETDDLQKYLNQLVPFSHHQ